jgi:hypothetical protein
VTNSSLPEQDDKDGKPASEAASAALDFAEVINEHKGKLAIGVAATLGLMVYYSWREKQLAKEDPEAHAMHQRSKAIVKAAESDARLAGRNGAGQSAPLQATQIDGATTEDESPKVRTRSWWDPRQADI